MHNDIDDDIIFVVIIVLSLCTSAEVMFRFVMKHTLKAYFSSILYDEMNLPFFRGVTDENELFRREDSNSSGTSYKCSSGCTATSCKIKRLDEWK